MEFAKRQLRKHGWSEGKGLGKNGDGIAEAIKVPLKKDNTGVGYTQSIEFTNQWWRAAFDDVLKNVHVAGDGDKIDVFGKRDDETMEPPKKITQKDRRKKLLMYGSFQKGSKSLQMEKETSAKTLTSTSNSSVSFESTQSTMPSSETGRNERCALTVNDVDLLKACGGRTAHKAARHGMKMGGKLRRIANQDYTLLKSTCSSGGLPQMAARKKSKHIRTKKCAKFHNLELTA